MPSKKGQSPVPKLTKLEVGLVFAIIVIILGIAALAFAP